MEILVVDNDGELYESIYSRMKRKGYSIRIATNLDDAVKKMKNWSFDLLVGNWIDEGYLGLECIKEIRRFDKTGVCLFMVSDKYDAVKIVEAFDAGLDDFLVRPFDTRILIARVQALLRRHVKQVAATEAKIAVNDRISLDLRKIEVTLDGSRIDLTKSEYKLFAAMVKNKGRALTREMLSAQVDGQDADDFKRSIDTHVFGLRKKLGEYGNVVETVRGIGYQVRLGTS